MKIGELAQRTNCHTETIRYYEKIGLLPEAQRNENNYRHYRPYHLERLRFIRNCRSLDMTHEEIRHFLGFMDQPEMGCQPVTTLITEHLAHVDARLQELSQLRQQLAELQAACVHEDTVQACRILEKISTMEPLPDANTHLG